VLRSAVAFAGIENSRAASWFQTGILLAPARVVVGGGGWERIRTKTNEAACAVLLRGACRIVLHEYLHTVVYMSRMSQQA